MTSSTPSNPVTYTDVLVELLAENPTFTNFCDSIDNVFTPNIDYPLDQLLRIRGLMQSDDIELRRDTLRLMGYDVTRDFITLNDNISQLPGYMFSLYYENAHSDDFWRFISYVLGKQVTVVPLYTNDYISFYDRPYGVENVDGGDWWKTTQVDVTVDIDGLSGKLIPNQGKTFQNRILDLFYEFSPINLVIRDFLFSLTLETKISFVGAFIFDRKMLYIGGDGLLGGQTHGNLDSISISGPDTILSSKTAIYKLILNWIQDAPNWQYKSDISYGSSFPISPSYGDEFYLDTSHNGFNVGLYTFGTWSQEYYVPSGTSFPTSPNDGDKFSLSHESGAYMSGLYSYSNGWVPSTVFATGASLPSNPTAEEYYGLLQTSGNFSAGVYVYHNGVWLNSSSYVVTSLLLGSGATGQLILLTSNFGSHSAGLYSFGSWNLMSIESGAALPSKPVNNQEFCVLNASSQTSSIVYIFSALWSFASIPTGTSFPVNPAAGAAYFLTQIESLYICVSNSWKPLSRGPSFPIGPTDGQYFYLTYSDSITMLMSWRSSISTWEPVSKGTSLPAVSTDGQYFYLTAPYNTYSLGLYRYKASNSSWQNVVTNFYEGTEFPSKPFDGQIFNYIIGAGLHKYIAASHNWMVVDAPMIQGKYFPDTTINERIFYLIGQIGLYAYSNRYTESVESTFSSSSTVISFDTLGKATAQSPQLNQVTTITANYGTLTATKDVTVIGVNTILSEKSVLIVGPDNADENTTQEYVAQILWSNGTTTSVSSTQPGGPNLHWYTLSPYLSFADPNNGSCTIETFDSDKSALIYLNYVSSIGVDFNATKTISLNTVVNAQRFLTSVEIVGPGIVPNKVNGETNYNQRINEESTYQYYCFAHYSNGDRVQILPVWHLISKGGDITTGGLLTTYKELVDITMNLTATYEIRGVSATLTETLYTAHTDNYIVNAAIISPGTTFLHNTQVQFHLNITWSDGNNNYSNIVRADKWTSSQFTINGNGLLKLGSVDPNIKGAAESAEGHGSGWIEVYAYYSYLGDSFVTSTYIYVVASYPTLDFISIRGPNTIKGATIGSSTSNQGTVFPTSPNVGDYFYLTATNTVGSMQYAKGLYSFSTTWKLVSIQLSCYANISDGSRTLLSLTNSSSHVTTGSVYWSLDNISSQFAAIDGYGNLTLTGVIPTSEVITVNAEYVSNVANVDINGNAVKDYFATYYVSVIVPILTLSSIKIQTSASIVNDMITLVEMSREQFSAIATMADGSTPTVQPTWTILSTETKYVADELAKIDRKGNLSVRSLSSSTVIILQAYYFGQFDQVFINLEQYSYALKQAPFSKTISGPLTLDPTIAYYQYALSIVETSGDTPTPLSATWAITTAPGVATINYNGTLHLLSYQPGTITITATYSCGFVSPVVATLIVTLPNLIQTGSLSILGPVNIFSESVTDYSATIVDNSGNTSDVTTNTNTVWSLSNVPTSVTGKVSLSPYGVLTVLSIIPDVTVRLNAVYTTSVEVYTGYLDVNITVLGAMYGVGPYGVTTPDDVSLWLPYQMTTSNSGGTFEVITGVGDYGYFMTPASYGLTTFTNTSNNAIGGWDGASWPQGSTATTNGPIIINIVNNGITTVYWLYRTDFDNAGLQNYQVTYTNR